MKYPFKSDTVPFISWAKTFDNDNSAAVGKNVSWLLQDLSALFFSF
jgi:hypothetical protein